MRSSNAYSVRVRDVPRPTMINCINSIVRLSGAAICGLDLHTYRGTTNAGPVPYGLDPEGMGCIPQVGDAGGSLRVGDPVIIPFTTAEGHVHTRLTTSLYEGGWRWGGDGWCSG